MPSAMAGCKTPADLAALMVKVMTGKLRDGEVLQMLKDSFVGMGPQQLAPLLATGKYLVLSGQTADKNRRAFLGGVATPNGLQKLRSQANSATGLELVVHVTGKSRTTEAIAVARRKNTNTDRDPFDSFGKSDDFHTTRYHGFFSAKDMKGDTSMSRALRAALSNSTQFMLYDPTWGRNTALASALKHLT